MAILTFLRLCLIFLGVCTDHLNKIDRLYKYSETYVVRLFLALLRAAA